MSTLTICDIEASPEAVCEPSHPSLGLGTPARTPARTPAAASSPSAFNVGDGADAATAENALLESLVAGRRQAIAATEAAYQEKLRAERDAECHRLNEVLARVLVRHGVSAG